MSQLGRSNGPSQLLRCKSIDALIAASEDPTKRLRKTLGPWSLTALGIGAVIGSGIFTLTGTAAAGRVETIRSVFNATILDLLTHGVHAGSMLGRPGAGPAITLSFVLVAFACCFAALCYAELASMIPIAGSAYTYSYAILGEIFAWIIGWDLILEYAVSNMSVAVGFFTYIGFDSVSTAAEECRRPQRDLPFGIIATLIICTILYASVSLVLTGIMSYTKLGTDSPVADALKALGYNRLRMVVTTGALM